MLKNRYKCIFIIHLTPNVTFLYKPNFLALDINVLQSALDDINALCNKNAQCTNALCNKMYTLFLSL